MKNKKYDQFLPYFFLVAIVAIVAISALFFYSNGRIEGAPVYKIQIEETQFPCVDDDPSNDYFVAGMTSFGKLEYLDSCRDGYLYQYQCATSNTAALTRPYLCPNGCLNGVCLR